MYVNPNFLVELQLDRQLHKHQIRTYLLISYRIFCSSKDNIMLAFLFLVSLENVYQQDIKIKMNISLSNAPRFLSNANSMRADSFYNFLKNCLTTVSDIIICRSFSLLSWPISRFYDYLSAICPRMNSKPNHHRTKYSSNETFVYNSFKIVLSCSFFIQLLLIKIFDVV